MLKKSVLAESRKAVMVPSRSPPWRFQGMEGHQVIDFSGDLKPGSREQSKKRQ
jgi:hypothetical protein